MPWFLQFWPILLVLVGLALLANAMKNLVLGWLAAMLALAAIGFGAWWIAHNKAEAGSEHASRVDLDRPRVEAVTVQARTFVGRLDLAAPSERGRPVARNTSGRALLVALRGVSEKDAAYRWSAGGRSGLFVWPTHALVPNTAPIGGALWLTPSPRTALRVSSTGYFSGANLDFASLRPERCDVTLYSSAARITVGDAPPERITIHGFAGAAEIRLPPSGPVRVEFHSPFTGRSLPDDFLEQVGGRGKARIWVSEGTGTPILVVVDGSLLYVKIKRAPQRAG
jgi:hypothetical protein